MEKTRLIALIVGGLAITAGVIGCGSGGSDDSTIGKAEFVKRANAICEGAHTDIQTGIVSMLAGREPQNPKDAKIAEAEVGRKVLLPAMRKRGERLRALGAPAGDEAQINAIIEANEEGLGKAARHPERAVKDGTEAFGKSNRLAREYGLTAC